jgi:hypothetical protein
VADTEGLHDSVCMISGFASCALSVLESRVENTLPVCYVLHCLGTLDKFGKGNFLRLAECVLHDTFDFAMSLLGL